MEEEEFMSLLRQFPVVRSNEYRENEAHLTSDQAARIQGATAPRLGGEEGAGAEAGRTAEAEDEGATAGSRSSVVQGGRRDDFWRLLREAAEGEGRLSREQAARFCQAYRGSHENMVGSVLSLDDVERIASWLLRQQCGPYRGPL